MDRVDAAPFQPGQGSVQSRNRQKGLNGGRTDWQRPSRQQCRHKTGELEADQQTEQQKTDLDQASQRLNITIEHLTPKQHRGDQQAAPVRS